MFQYKQNNCMNFPLTHLGLIILKKEWPEREHITVEQKVQSTREPVLWWYKLQKFLSVFLEISVTPPWDTEIV